MNAIYKIINLQNINLNINCIKESELCIYELQRIIVQFFVLSMSNKSAAYTWPIESSLYLNARIILRKDEVIH